MVGHLDERFAHFCRTGEPAALGEVFDGTARELLHVAVWLAGNRADAEDLLQRTFLAAIELRARFATEQRVLPWLMGLLAIEARHLRRERARRVVAPSPAPAPDPEAVATAKELDDAVGAAGAELSEPYRDVLRLHLQQGLNAKEIAERLQRPAGTVRTQLVRALELLRRRLPGGFVAGMAPLLVPEQAVLATARTAVMHAAKLAVPAAVAGAATWTAIGSLTMTKKLATAAAVVLLLCLGVLAFAWRDAEAKPVVAVANAVQAEVLAAPAGTAPSELRTAVEIPVKEPTTPATGSLLVRVTWQKESGPAANVGIAVFPQRDYVTLHELLAVTDAAGECRFDDLQPGAYQVNVALGSTEAVAVTAGATAEVNLRAHRAATVRGVVVDEFDRAVEGADIWLSEHGGYLRGYVVARSDAQGRFTIPVGSDHYLGARKAGYTPSYWRQFFVRDQHELEFTLQLRSAGGTVRGRVLDAEHRPIAGARVFVGHEINLQAPGMRGLNSETKPRGATVATDGEGTFELVGVEPGPTEIRAWADGMAPGRNQVDVAAGAIASVDLVLLPAATLTGTVRDDRGEPIAAANVGVGDRHHFTHALTRTDAAGRYVLTNLGAGPIEVTASASAELQAKTTVVLGNGATATWDPVLSAGRVLRGVVLDAADRPMAGIYVERRAWMAPDSPTSQATDAEGRFTFANIQRDVVHVVSVQSREGTCRTAVTADQNEVVLRIRESDLATASLSLRLVDGAGRPFAAKVLFQEIGSNASRTVEQEAVAALVAAKMRPGTYELYAQTADMILPLPTVTLRPHEARDLGDIVVPASARLRVHVWDEDGRPVASGRVQMVTATGQRCIINPPAVGKGEVELTAPPGTWTLLVATGTASAAAAVELLPGTPRELSVTIAGCQAVPLTIVPDATVFAFGMFRVLVHDTTGRLRHVSSILTRRDGSIASTVHLPPGDYTCTAKGPDDSSGTAAVSVSHGAAAAAVRIALHASHR